MLRFNDGVPIRGARRTRDGYLVGQVRCARSGIQIYTKDELKLEEGPEIIRVYRPPEAVFDERSLSTYAGKPVTLGHPKEQVKASNWKTLSIGTTGSKVMRDGDAVVVEFSIMDEAAITGVEDGTAEISMGYSTPMEMQDGVTPEGEPYDAIQTGPILINHMAVVANARGGNDLRILMDAAPWGATPVNTQAENKTMTTRTVVIGDSAVTVSLADAAAIEAFKTSMTTQLQTVTDAAAKDKMEKDEEIGKLKAKNKELTDAAAAFAPDKLTKLIADRAALETRAKALVPTVVTDSVSDTAIRKAVVLAKLGDSMAEASDAEIAGAFKALTASLDVDDTMREAIQSRPVNDAAAGGWSDSIAARSGVTMKKKG